MVPETLWVLEQMPGMVEMADMSLYLIENGYWASYNIPYVLFFPQEIVEDLKTNCNKACSNIQYSDYLENALSTQPVGRLEICVVLVACIFLTRFLILFYSFFEAISTVSDQESMVKKYGPWFDYNLHPRAQIFKRDQSKVVDLPSMMKLMRLVGNNFYLDQRGGGVEPRWGGL